MLIGPLHRRGDTVSARLVTDGGATTISYVVPSDVVVAETIDPVFAAALLPAMKRGDDLCLDGPVSPALLRQSELVQDIFVTWDRALHPRSPWYRRIEVTAPDLTPSELPTGDDRGAACFFTGGVDSFHSVLAHRDDLAALVYVWGFDIDADDHPRQAMVRRHLRAAAEELGLPLIEVTTDVRTVMDRLSGIPWIDHHGAALASVALLLAPTFSRCYLPATYSYAQLTLLGSHPLLDPLWSNEHLTVVHDGADASRLEKVRAIASNEVARRHLRVCWENRDDAYNCGRCEKCLRTAVAARVAGCGGAFELLPEPSTLDVARCRLHGPSLGWFECRDELAWSKRNPRLRWAIQLALARRQVGETRESMRRLR